MADVAVQLSSIASGTGDQKQKLEQYKAILSQVISTRSLDSCKVFVDHVLSDDVPLVVSRPLVLSFSQDVKQLPSDLHKQVATYTLERLQPRVVSFEDSVTLIRENLADVLEKEEDWSKAAQILAGIDLDSGKAMDVQYKLGKNIKIAMLYLEDDDPVNAEMFIKKASALITAIKDPTLELQYKVCYARILDSKRRFLEAALRYYELSSLEQKNIGDKMVDDDDLTTALNSAITCTVLAPAGPQRARMLSTLYRDERTAHLPLHSFLEKVFLERILRQEEVEGFKGTLKPHQLATLPDGSTVLSRAVMQHNLGAAAKLYTNIHTGQLGTLLGVSEQQAEAIAADMIAEGRLKGSIDQVDGLIRFDIDAEPQLAWDQQIQGICQSVNDIVDQIVQQGIAVEGL